MLSLMDWDTKKAVFLATTMQSFLLLAILFWKPLHYIVLGLFVLGAIYFGYEVFKKK